MTLGAQWRNDDISPRDHTSTRPTTSTWNKNETVEGKTISQELVGVVVRGDKLRGHDVVSNGVLDQFCIASGAK